MDIKNIAIEELVEGVNTCYSNGFKSLEKIAIELQKGEEKKLSHAFLSKRILSEGYVFKDKHYIKVNNNTENKDDILKADEYKYVATVKCTKQLANRVDADIYAEFNKLADERLNGINKSKLLSLAIKNFVDRFNK